MLQTWNRGEKDEEQGKTAYAVAARTPDHGHSLPARTRHGRRSAFQTARQTKLFDGAGATSRAGREGHVRHEEEGLRYVYLPCVPREVARRSALRHLVETFFEGSTEKAVAALLGGEVSRISSDELDRLAALIAREKNEGSL